MNSSPPMAPNSSWQHWIVGPGALGRLVGLRLATGGTVTLVGRRARPTRQQLVTPRGEIIAVDVATASLTNLPANTPDVVHLTTKAYAAEKVYAALATRLDADIPLVLWQNGFDCQPRLSRRHPGPVLCATTTEGAYVEHDSVAGDARVVHAGHGETLVGTLDDHHGELASTLAATLSAAGLPAQAVDDIRQRLWQKLVVNAAINPLVARYRLLNGQLRQPPFHDMVEEITREAAAILSGEGIMPPVGQGAQGWLTLVWRVVTGTADNRASMLQDVLAGRPTEHVAILGPLLEAASRRHIAAPRLSELAAWLEARELALASSAC